MKHLFFLLVSPFFVLPCLGQTFEGILYYTYTTQGQSMECSYWVGAEQTAYQLITFPSGKQSYEMVMYFRPASKEVTLTGNTEKGKFKKTYGTQRISSRFHYDSPTAQVLETGETKIIQGKPCKQYLFTLETYRVEAWIQSDWTLPVENFIPYLKDDIVLQLMAKWEIKGIPYETRIYDANGNIEWETHLSKIHAEAMPPKVFEISPEFVEGN